MMEPVQTPVAPESLKGRLVLYVDDEEENRLVFSLDFEDEFDVLCAQSGAEALEIIEREPVAVLLADQRMPSMSGIELCQIVRERYPGILRVLVTAYSDQRTAIDAINRGGVVRYLVKPWDMETVRQVLRDTVTRSRLESMVRKLRGSILDAERSAGVAAARACILHDASNLQSVVTLSCEHLDELLDGLRPWIPTPVFEEIRLELADLRTATVNIAELFRRARSLTTPRHVTSQSHHRVEELLGMVARLVRLERPSGPQFTIECEPNVEMWADFIDISRILVNLITNAKQALEASDATDGHIQIVAYQTDQWIVVDIWDNGPGIPHDLQRRLFSPFFTTRRECGGTGLGLSTCRGLAHANRGRVEFVPSDEPRGARFRLCVPARRDCTVR